MTAPCHQSHPGRMRSLPWVASAVVCGLVIVGCVKIQIPDMGQQTSTPAPTTTAPTQTQQSAPAPVPVQPAQPDPKLVVAAFLEKSKQLGQLRDQDIIQVSELKEGLEAVTELKIIGGEITDASVTRLSKFPNLAAVDLSASLVTNEGLAVIKEMPQLANLNLSNTKVDDRCMASVGTATGLRELSVSHTGVTDFGISELADVENLEVLDISFTQITGAGFEKFRKNKSLRVLRGQHSRMQNEALKFLVNCPIEELNLDMTGIGDPAMVYIGKMKHMKHLSLEFNSISDFGAKKLGIMKDLETITVRNNGAIGGMLFERLKNSKKLQSVNAAGTRVTPTQCAMLMKLIPGCRVTGN